ncbi:DUF2637 domain-containing protein [Actinokineospora auranticolor]|uniref:Uncharacterized protein DUF2637 n=1 Tax=Actinokineospora auranticolor TaxID=155976 RepID=A0A2S6GMJ6_9PSEU|nr:DUF2637 domain-containing protein [Actinokineospora auranticolor]PPK66400.1 uncharacterized protein DUF2637 [Actinokineospora auranticolor]
MSPKIDTDPTHTEALTALATLADKIRYACENVDPPTTLGVKQWLDAYGIHVTATYATGIINTWRGENKIGDTGDLVALSPELLAELDALRSHESATDSHATADRAAADAPTAVIPAVTADGPAAPTPPSSTGSDTDANTVDTDRTASAADSGAVATETPAATESAATATLVADPAPDADTDADTDGDVVDADTDEVGSTSSAVVVAEQPTASSAGTALDTVPYIEARAERVVPPEAERSEPLTPQVPTVLSWSANMAWIVVLVAAMGISWWSLFEYARAFSIPTPLAAVVSLVFDASALIVAGLAHRYALSPYSGAGPRFALLALLAGSVYLNWEHAAGKGYGIEASIMFAAPAAVGILLFELHIGWHSRSERRARGRVARSLPVIGAWGWFLHPLQSVTTLWRVTHARGHSVREAELISIEQLRQSGTPV